MSTPTSPPILEIEDRPQSIPRPESPPPDNPQSIPPPSDNPQSTPPPPTVRKEQRTANLQVKDVPDPHINDHAPFWSIYNKEADEFDAEMLKAWNNSLDVLLIFAGLFSAVNTAFIIESYKGLSPDPIETTNALLRLLIIHRSDNITLTVQDLDPVEANPSALRINYIFFASLYSSLSAAFGAVTAKQWLTEYSNKGPAKAPHVLGTQRVTKFKGLEEWHFQFIIDLLPILLQLSLVLFLVGVVEFLWVIDRKIGMMQLILVVMGVAVYAAMLLIGVISPTSPFRTPATKHIIKFSQVGIKYTGRAYWVCDKPGRLLSLIGRYIRSCDLANAAIHLLMLLPLPLLCCWKLIAALFGYLTDRWKGIAGSFGYLRKKARSLAGFAVSRREGNHRWDDEEQKAAESVIWLLEHSEHPDITIVALDAARRLPPALVSSMIRKRDGLDERLDKFCAGLLPPESLEPLQWAEALSDRAVISAMAWCYVYPSWAFIHAKTFQDLDNGPPAADNIPGSPRLAIRLLVTINIWLRADLSPELVLAQRDQWARSLISNLKYIDFSTVSNQILIELNYGIQASLFTSLSTQVSLTQLALNTLISNCWVFDPLGYRSQMSVLGWDKVPWNEVPQILEAILQAESSLGNIRRVAFVVTAISIVARCTLHLDRLKDSDKERKAEYELRTNLYDLSIGRTSSRVVWSYVELAVTQLDSSGDEIFRAASVNIHYTLLNLTKKQWRTEPPRNLRFYTGLLHLSSVYPNDLPTQQLVFELLILIPEPSHLLEEQNKDDLRSLVKTGLSLQSDVESPRSPHHEFLSLTSSISSDKQFFSLFSSALHDHSNNHGIPASHMALPFIYCRILRSDSSKWPHPKTTYSYQITLALAIIQDKQRAEDVLVLIYFLTCMMLDAQFHWPARFPSSRIEAIVNSYLHFGRQLNFQGRHYEERMQDSSEQVNRVIKEHNLENTWSGECVMMLWKGTCKAFREGRLPDDWNDAAFFKANILDTMIQYYRHVIQQQDVKLDRDSLRSYFEMALKGWQPNGDSEPSALKNNLGEERPRDVKESLEDGSKAEVTIREGERVVDIALTPNGEEIIQEDVSAVGRRHREIECILGELGA